MARTFYLVGHNMAGYLGDSDNLFIVRSKKSAISASHEEARNDLEALNDGLVGSGERKAYTYHMSGKQGDYWLCADRGADYHYWVHEVSGELTTLKPAESKWDHERCMDCERVLADGESERVYYIQDCEGYLCRDC